MFTINAIVGGVMRQLCLHRGSWILTYFICLSVKHFYVDFRKWEPVSNFRLNRFLGGFLKIGFLLASFYCTFKAWFRYGRHFAQPDAEKYSYALLLGKRVLNLNFSQSLIVATIHSKQLFPWKLKLLRLLNVSLFQVF